ncbi:helix-turn-helix transcriptional regulator [Planosporangium flavigriseum]|uniref:Transcriptional regulator n=2 Tax=Planosporangium flavigriseum TaxID=373681 RepID=A0A8J3PNE9_9ACTN|nr:winged helix-turn-helix domain-containing protein [Planosporangium flavigriseum]NJC64346.1 helix-turn-helix transcriptional regulator [Planosporangium flavigriseum]GIG73871.1 transcriptional regulator [Planosporangium flavigriseum]
MRALAHPARMAIIDALATGQTGTATQFAQVVGLSPSATSYHLRALAKYGLVEEAPSRGDGRERVWQRARSGLRFEAGPNEPPEVWEAGRLLVDAVLARDEAQARQWMESADSDDPEWHQAARITKIHLLVTAEELEKLNEAVDELLKPYSFMRRLNPPEGARSVVVNYRAFPIDRLASGDHPQ